MIQRRLDAVRRELKTHRLQAFLVTDAVHIRYLTGFSGSNGICVVTPSKQFLITDRRYKDQAPAEVRDFTVIIAKQKLFPLLVQKNLVSPKARIGIEQQHLTVSEWESLKKILPGRRFLPADDILISLTAVKDDGEIESIRTAAHITDAVFKKILPLLRPGVREIDVAAEISYWHRRYGAECDAFDPIVASGERSAMPHARASEKKIRKGEMVVLDFGCRYRGYHSDLTRTIAIGKPSTEMRSIYQIVLDAQKQALETIRGGITARRIDGIARKHIRKNGYGRYFFHSLGHGLGIHVHDALRLSALSTAVLEEGNVVTVEPGIYVPGSGGVRIEDDVVVRKNGCEVLTASPKELMIM